jgi:hypothetical protein
MTTKKIPTTQKHLEEFNSVESKENQVRFIGINLKTSKK